MVLTIVVAVTAFAWTGHRRRVDPPSMPHFQLLEPAVYDFGEMDEGLTVVHSFQFQNSGSSNLRILKLSPGCSCTGAHASKLELGPGENGAIEVRYEARPTDVKEFIPVIVETSDPQMQFVRLGITGSTNLHTYWRPKSLSFFHEGPGVPPPQTIELLTSWKNPLLIEGISTSSGKIAATFKLEEDKYICNVSVAGDCPVGNSTEYLIVRSKVKNIDKTVRIPVYLMIH
jgi:hypothetical protein